MTKLKITTTIGITGYLEVPDWILEADPENISREMVESIGFILGGIVGNYHLATLCEHCTMRRTTNLS